MNNSTSYWSSVNRVLILCFVIGCLGCSTQKEKPKTILVVVAHPDDETGFGAALAKHARLGDAVYLVVAVDAKYDTRFISASPDSLTKAKQRDVLCSCEKLKIQPPIFFSFTSMDRKHGAKERWCA